VKKISEGKIKIKATNLMKVFKERKQIVVALENMNLEIQEGEFAVIVGPSGLW